MSKTAVLHPPTGSIMNSKRNFRRIDFRSDASVRSNGREQSCKLVDLALQGALFDSPTRLPLAIGQHAELSIFLPESDVCLNFKAKLIHQSGSLYGFLFVSRDDVSMGHLRRLLELNIGDAEEVEQEFIHWLQQNR